jgi:hypothetical protein
MVEIELVERDIRVLKAGHSDTATTSNRDEDSELLGSYELSSEDQVLTQAFGESRSQHSDGASTRGPFSIALPSVFQGQSQEVYGTLTFALLSELCDIWFAKYHNWFPILHSPSLLDALQDTDSLTSCPFYIVFKAIAVVTLPVNQTLVNISKERRAFFVEMLRREVVIEAIRKVNIHSLKGLLILTISYHGEGNIPEFWNLLALCKRYAQRL